MNFIDAALSLLKKSRRALTVEQLVEQAENEELLARPGKDPQRSMKAALSRELKRGEDSRVGQVGEDRWKLAKGAAKEVEAGKTTKKKTTTARKTGAEKTAQKTTKKTATKKATTRKTAAKKATTEKKAPKKTAPEKATEKKATEKKARARKPGKAARPAAEPVDAVETLEGRVDYNDIDSSLAEIPAPTAPVIEAPAEVAAEVAVAGEVVIEGAGEAPGRKPGRKRRSRRGRRAAAAQLAMPEAEAVIAEAVEVAPVAEEASAEVAEVLAPREQPVRAEAAGAPAEDELEAIYGDELAGIEPGAAFAEYRDAQTEDEDRPMVPEIVATRRDRVKRERRKRRRDQRERYRGGEEAREGARPVEARPVEAPATTPAPVRPVREEPRRVRERVAETLPAAEVVEAELQKAEDELDRATEAVADTTRAMVKARLGTLSLTALERVVHTLLVRQGWKQIEWIKRVQRSAYAVAQAPDGLGTVLVGVRAGDEPVDRRGVGELRVGVQAKKLPGGLLLSPQPLSEVARQELRRNGPSISLLVGDAFVSALVHHGIGVRAKHVPLSLMDESYFRDLAGD